MVPQTDKEVGMYKLLLITDRTEILQIYANLDIWAEMGFRTPRMAASVDEGLDILSRHFADAVAIELSEPERDRLYDALNAQYPALPVMTAGETPDEVTRNLKELRHLLNQLNADYSNDRYDPAEKMQLRRHAFFRKLLEGSFTDEGQIRRELRLLRSRMDPDRPCVVMRMETPTESGYLAEHWQYGQDRLEVAMRNIFGAELEGMRILVSALEDERLYLVACPMKGCAGPSSDASMTRLVHEHTQESIDHVKEYLGMDLRIGAEAVLPSIVQLAGLQL